MEGIEETREKIDSEWGNPDPWVYIRYKANNNQAAIYTPRDARSKEGPWEGHKWMPLGRENILWLFGTNKMPLYRECFI